MDSPTRLRILYVDDERPILRSFRWSLRNESLDITTRDHPRQALELLKSQEFEIICADYRMPDMNGVDFLESARDRYPDSCRILITALHDFDTAQQAINRAGVHSFVMKPWTREDILGVMHTAMKHVQIRLDNERLQKLLHQRNEELSRVNSELEQMNRELESLVQQRTVSLLNGLISALDFRDTETQWHSRRVAYYTRMIAGALGLDDEQTLQFERGALLHDIGKIGISDTILLKPARLTEEEWKEIRKHPRIGYCMLDRIDFLRDARCIVLHHHERFEGGGYPDQLAGQDIHLGARIFTVVDTIDAMTSSRRYRKALSFTETREEIQSCSGSQFDPEVVEAFSSIPVGRWRAAIHLGQSKDPESPVRFDPGDIDQRDIRWALDFADQVECWTKF